MATGASLTVTPGKLELRRHAPDSVESNRSRLCWTKQWPLQGTIGTFLNMTGQRYSHTIDPSQSRPVAHKLTSVSVVAGSCTEADAWATALLVLGHERARQVAQEHSLAMLLMHYEGTSLVQTTSAGFPQPAADQASGSMMFLATVLAFAIAIAGMAIGVIVSNRRLKGSCGGLSADGQQTPCSMCTVPAEQCRDRQKWASEQTELA